MGQTVKIRQWLFHATASLGLLTAVTLGTAQAAIINNDLGVRTTNGVPLALDINADGRDDLTFLYRFQTFSDREEGDLWVTGLNGAAITDGGPFAAGAPIDSSLAWSSSNHLADYNGTYFYYGCGTYSYCTGIRKNTSGSWNNELDQVTAYLGFALSAASENLYGWVSLTMNYWGVATINTLAYEATPAAPLMTGQSETTLPAPTTLVLLATGALLAPGIRRRRNKCDSQANQR